MASRPVQGGGVHVAASGQAVVGAGQVGPGAGRLAGIAVVQDVRRLVADPGHLEHAGQSGGPGSR